MGCTLANLGECLPQAFTEFVLSIANGALSPLLDLTQKLFTASVEVSAFKSLWLIIVSVLSLFYGLIIVYAGFNFLLSGFDASRKEEAKSWLKNVLLMIILVQASFFLYKLLVEIGALLTAGMFSLIPPEYFLLNADTHAELGLSLMFSIVYALTMLVTVVLLALRYLLVMAGVVLFPIGLFLNYFPPLRGLGKMILWLVGTMIFMPFLASIGLVFASRLAGLEAFVEASILTQISGFLLVDLLIIILIAVGVLKAVHSLLEIRVIRDVTDVLL